MRNLVGKTNPYLSLMEKKVIVTIQDEFGNIVSEKSCSLGADTDNLSKIEAGIENLWAKCLLI